MKAAEKRRFVGIDLGKRTWTMAVITRTVKTVKNGKRRPRSRGHFVSDCTCGFFAQCAFGALSKNFD
jgi:hypothetical protein